MNELTTNEPRPDPGDDLGLGTVTQASAAIAGWTLASRISGFLRAALVAAVLGPTFFGNLFQVANTLPNLLYEFVVGSLLVSLLVPPLVRHLEIDGDLDRARRVADGFLGVIMVLFCGFAVVVVAAGPLVLRVLGAGIHDPAVLADQRRIGWPLLALLVPQTIFYGIVGISAAVQNAHGRFSLTAAAPVVENVGVMLAFAAFALRYGTGVDFDTVTPGGVLLIGGGSTLAVAGHATVQWLGARRVGHTLIPRAGWRDPDVRSIIRVAIPSLGYAALNSVRILVMLIAAGSVPGGVVAFQFAYNFYNLPGALISKPISVASLPTLSRHVHDDSPAAYRSLYETGQRLARFLLAPCAAVLVVLAVPITRAVAFGAMASTSGRRLLAVSIAGVALGILGEGMFLLATSASYARRDARPPLESMALRTVGTVVCAIWALQSRGVAVVAVIAFGASGADIVAGLLLHRRLVATLPRGDEPAAGMRSAVRVLVATVAAVAAGSGIERLVGVAPGLGRPAQLGALGAASTGMLLAYLVVARALGSPELSALHTVRRRSRVRSDPTGLLSGPSGSIGPVVVRSVAPTRVPAFVIGSAGLLLALMSGVLATTVGLLLPAFLLGAVLFVSIYRRPQLGAYLLVGVGPFIVGIDRGKVVPLLRLNEVLLGAVVAALVARALLRPRGRVRLTAPDVVMVVLALVGGLLPLVVRFSRAGTLSSDEILAVAPLWKLALVYAVFRAAVRDRSHVFTVMRVSLVVAAVVSLVGFCQTLGLLGLRSLLASNLFVTTGSDVNSVVGGRGTSLIGSAIGAAGFYVVNLLIALAWLRSPSAPRRFLRIVIGLLLVGIAGTAQFTALPALAAGVSALWWHRRARRPRWMRTHVVRDHRRVAAGGALAVVAGAISFGPRLNALTNGHVPQSWSVRWYNLSTYFLPPLRRAGNAVWGVTPVAQIADPRHYTPWVWIESGYVWLLWSGGILLVAAFAALIMVHGRAARAAAAVRADEFGVVAAAAAASLVMLAVIMLFDPHITMRGTADILYPVLAIAASAAAGVGRASGPRVHGEPIGSLVASPIGAFA